MRETRDSFPMTHDECAMEAQSRLNALPPEERWDWRWSVAILAHALYIRSLSPPDKEDK